jgi:hypothetical protein
MENNYLLNGFTELQKKIMPTMADCFYRYRCREGVYTNELICELMERHGLGPREWQGSLVGLGKKDYITYGNGWHSSDGAIFWLQKSLDFFNAWFK